MIATLSVQQALLRATRTAPMAPVSRERILCFIAERELGLPKSY